MKNCLSLLLLVLPLSVSSRMLSKNEVLAHAFTHAEELHLIKNEMDAAKSMEKEYWGKGLPSIEASVNYQYAPEQFMPYSLGMGESSGETISEGLIDTVAGFANDARIAGALDNILGSFSDIDLTPPRNTIAMELSLTQPIFAQGKISKGLKIAKMFHSALDLKYKAVQFKLAQEITDAYYGAVMADQNLEVQRQAVALAEENHRLTKAQLESGKGNVLDTLNTRYSLQEARFDKRNAEKNRLLALKKLLTIASMQGNPDEIQLSDSLVVVDFSVDNKDAAELLKQKNTNLQQIDKGIEIQTWQTKIAKADFLPTVYAGASLSKITMFNGGENIEWGDDQKVYIGTTIPLFSGGQKVQKVRQAVYEEEKLRETRKQTLNQLSLALANFYEELAVAREECTEAEQLIALTTQGAEIALLSYEIGQITQVELTKSRQQLSQSKLAYNSAVNKLNKAITGIKMLLGDESLLLTGMEDK